MIDEQVMMEDAVQLKRMGHLQESRAIYQKVIAEIPQCDPAYKGLAKVEIVSGRYEAAIRALLMKMDLGIFFTNQCPPFQVDFMRMNAINNLSCDIFNEEITVGNRVFREGTVSRLLKTDVSAMEVSLLAWAEMDIFFYLGHCLVRLFPTAFSQCAIPESLMKNFENAMLGHPSGEDARNTCLAPCFYISGFILACANIKSPITTIDPVCLKKRYNRVLNFLNIDKISGDGNFVHE